MFIDPCMLFLKTGPKDLVIDLDAMELDMSAESRMSQTRWRMVGTRAKCEANSVLGSTLEYCTFFAYT